MPTIKPFSGVLYSPRVPAARVVTQPYDKIDAAMQAAYYRRHPNNFIRIILGKTYASDNGRHNRYTRAARSLENWMAKGVLRRDAGPAFYLYEQTFRVGGRRLTRTGIVGLLKLGPRGEVLPHERTLSKPRRDRLNMLKATKANLEQIFLLYEDPKKRLVALLRRIRKKKAILSFAHPQGVAHRLWRITDARAAARIGQVLGRRRLFIADGHHRFRVAGMFHAGVRRGKGKLARNSAWRMATFVGMDDPGLVILPTHRAVAIPRWDEQRFFEGLREDFLVDARPMRGGLGAQAKRLARQIAKAAKPAAFGVLTRRHAAVLRPRPELIKKLRLPTYFRGLDVALLHEGILRRHLRIGPKTVERGGRISYSRTPEQVARKIASGGYAVGFLQNPPAIRQVRDVALAGACMPQKSTDFYPKLLSGLVLYDMMERS